MYRLDHIIAAVLIQRIRQCRVKHVLLLGGRHRRLHAEHRVDDLLVELSGVPAVKKCVVNIGGPVVKGRIQKAQLR